MKKNIYLFLITVSIAIVIMTVIIIFGMFDLSKHQDFVSICNIASEKNSIYCAINRTQHEFEEMFLNATAVCIPEKFVFIYSNPNKSNISNILIKTIGPATVIIKLKAASDFRVARHYR